MRKLKGVGDFLGSRPRNKEISFRKSKEIYREKVKTNLVEMTNRKYHHMRLTVM